MNQTRNEDAIGSRGWTWQQAAAEGKLDSGELVCEVRVAAFPAATWRPRTYLCVPSPRPRVTLGAHFARRARASP